MSADQSVSQRNLHYGLEDVPKPFPKALGLGIQHVLTMFGATIVVPLLLGPAMDFDAAQIAILISSVFICSGVATAIQVTIGSRLPIVQGVSFAFLAPFFAIIAAHPGENAMRYIAGAIMAGAIIEIIIGFGGLFGLLRRFVTPVVIAPVIALIGLALFQAGADTASTHWPMAFLTLALIFVYSLILAPKVRFFSLFPVLLAIITSYVVSLILTGAGVFAAEADEGVSFAGVGDAPWVRGVEIGGGGILFPWGTPLFDIGFFVAILAAYLASMIESFGDYHAVNRIAAGRDPERWRINRGIGSEGIGCFITGLLGGFSSTSYSENIGLVGLTRVASRYVVLLGGIVLVVLGLIVKVGAVIATIPTPVVGGTYLALFGLIAAVGLSLLQRADMNSQRNLLIVGFTLFSGFVFPAYFGAVEDFSFFGIEWLTPIVEQVGSSGMAVAAFFGLILDNIIPGTPEERGIGAWDTVVPPGEPAGPEEARDVSQDDQG